MLYVLQASASGMIAKEMNAQNPLFTSNLIWMMQSLPFAAIIVTLGMRRGQTMSEDMRGDKE